MTLDQYGKVRALTPALLTDRGYVARGYFPVVWNNGKHTLSQAFVPVPSGKDGPIAVYFGGLNGPEVRYLHELIARESV